MYSGALVLLIGTPLALGSWWALLLVPLFLPILIVRILNEEKVLARRLLDYTEYQQKVRSHTSGIVIGRSQPVSIRGGDQLFEPRLALKKRELAQIAAIVVQEIEGPHAEAAIVSVEMQPVEIWQAFAVAPSSPSTTSERTPLRHARASTIQRTRLEWSWPFLV
jgi:hypothetical protein